MSKHIDAFIVRQIARDNNQLIVEQLRELIRELHADLDSGAVVLARRYALLHAIEVVEKTVMNKPYVIPDISPLEVKEYGND